MKAHQAFFLARLDVDSFRSTLLSGGYFMSQSIVSTLCENTPDVMAAHRCKPRFVWANNAPHDGTGITLKRLQEDIDRLAQAEAAYENELQTAYDFTPAPKEESPNIDREPELAEQTA